MYLSYVVLNLPLFLFLNNPQYTKYVFQNFIHTYVHVCVYMCSCIYFYECLHAYIHVCMHPCMCAYTYMCYVLFTHSDHISTNVLYEHGITGERDIGIETQSSRDG